jgi:hypothetical protein
MNSQPGISAQTASTSSLARDVREYFAAPVHQLRPAQQIGEPGYDPLPVRLERRTDRSTNGVLADHAFGLHPVNRFERSLHGRFVP